MSTTMTIRTCQFFEHVNLDDCKSHGWTYFILFFFLQALVSIQIFPFAGIAITKVTINIEKKI